MCVDRHPPSPGSAECDTPRPDSAPTLASGHEPPTTVVSYEGRECGLYNGRVLLNWRDRPTLHHSQGCRLCCTVRVKVGDQLRHPGGGHCPGCGSAWESRRPDPCRFCHRTAHFHDDAGRPVHKTCLETALTEGLRTRQRKAA